jgi:hypothetical protein
MCVTRENLDSAITTKMRIGSIRIWVVLPLATLFFFFVQVVDVSEQPGGRRTDLQ